MRIRRNPDDLSLQIVASKLQGLLASTYELGVATHGLHWNIEGPNFASLHTLLETQYVDLITLASDRIAEVIRALGFYPLATMAAFVDQSFLDHSLGETLQSLIDAHENICDYIGDLSELIGAGGRVSARQMGTISGVQNMLDERIAAHEKMIWMLKAANKDSHERYY